MFANETTFDRIEKLDWSGALIPLSWVRHLRTGKGLKERCYHEALLILAEVAYWYRPAKNGKKRYQGRQLQLSYSQIANRLGMTKNAAKLATDYLEARGLIKKDFRTVYSNGKKYANVLFIELNLDRLEEITRLEA